MSGTRRAFGALRYGLVVLVAAAIASTAAAQLDGSAGALMQSPANDWGPMWSPDGEHIAFYSDRDGNTELYVSDGEGQDVRNVSHSAAADRDAAWSPDGSRLAFVAGDERGDIHVVDVGDGSQRVIAVHDGRDWGPAWAPDGLRLAFLSDREGGSHIYVVDVDVDLAPPVRLTWGMAEQREVAWSPDGSGLAFISHRYGLTDIYMYDSNGGSLRALTRQADPSGGPAWAPDGGRLAYVSRIDGNAEVYVVGVESLGTRNLSQHGMADGSPVWSPDSSRLAFVSSRDGNAEVFVIDADGTGARNVTQNEFADGAPSWSPDGRLAFATNRDGNWQIYVHTPAPDAAWDVNDDGRVDILDLVTVAQTFGASGADLAGDVTGDGTVNILDLVLVAAHFGEATVVGAAPARTPRPSDASMIEDWLDAARGADDGSAGHRRGIETLRRLLAGLTPDTTALLRNYPNPFNPETWIPFRLSSEAQVAITVYDVTGKVVREIDVGALAPGDYLTQGRAAHWDGRNLIGEPVGSGVYYIELRAGTYRAVDRLIMAK